MSDTTPDHVGYISQAPLHKPDRKPTLIVNSNTYHRDEDGKVREFPSRFSRHLNSIDEVYSRKLVIGEQWVKLDTAWIKDIGYLQILNIGGKPFNVIPTEEQRLEAQSRILELGYYITNIIEVTEQEQKRRTAWDKPKPTLTNDIEAFWLIPPGESMQGPNPDHTKQMYLRCQHGEISVLITAMPN